MKNLVTSRISNFFKITSSCYNSSFCLLRTDLSEKKQPSKIKKVFLYHNLFINHQKNISMSSVDSKLIKSYENILQSSQDKRQYKGLLLENGLKCLLISDPLTDRSAAAVDVHAGYMLDPKDFPGLAHFCEHMLFMGSKKVYNLTLEVISFKI